MRVRCVSALPNDSQARLLGPTFRPGQQTFGLVVDHEYLVFGLRIVDGLPWVDITDEARDARYLFSAPLLLFDISDDSVPAIWVARLTAEGQFRLAAPSMFAEYYFDDLFEEKVEIIEDFQRVRRQLEQGPADFRR